MDNTYRMRVAEAVRTAIDERSNVNRVAIATGISRGTLIRRLEGPSPFTVGELALIAEALDVPVETLAAPSAAA